VFAAHSALDWDWEMPALTLVAVVLAGFVLALTDDGPPAGRGPRVALAALAAVLVAGLAVELRAANLVASDRLDGLERAESLSLDATTPQLARANVLLLTDRPREAAALGEELVEREPENPFAWGIVALANEDSDPQRAREALRVQRRLIGREPR
jgi:hypothetical protein